MEVVRAGAGDVGLLLDAAELFDAPPTREWSERFLASEGHHLLGTNQLVAIFRVFILTLSFMPGTGHTPKRCPIVRANRRLFPFHAQRILRFPEHHEGRHGHAARQQMS